MSYDDGSLDRHGDGASSSTPGTSTRRSSAGAAVVGVLGRLRDHFDHWPQRHVEQQVRLYGDEE